ncbi:MULTISPECIES: hypothetical protein [unclassified Streptomyces]|uniref:hypothetical protein n=1 Tax=unclassified Streptomyces TaxID=2593676 RepID=UPI002E27D3DE|nr:hypothetical protein [Streptomyces sp. NBC_01439]
MILSFSHVASGEYEDEAAFAVQEFTALKSALPHFMGIVYVGAFRASTGMPSRASASSP